MLHSIGSRASHPLPNMAFPQRQVPDDPQSGHVCQQHCASSLRYPLRHMRLCKVRASGRQLEPDGRRQMLERVCLPRNQLQLICHHLCIIYDTVLDPYTDGSQSGQE